MQTIPSPYAEQQFPQFEKAMCSEIPEMTQNALLFFGQMLMRSFAPVKQYTVAEWIDHVIDSKSTAGRKRKTISGYRYCAIRVKRIIGDMRLCDVQPADISDLLNQLKTESVQSELRAVFRKDISPQQILDEEHISKTRLAKIAGISQSTTDRALSGYNVLLPKAAAIAAALNRKTEDLFQMDMVTVSKRLGHLEVSTTQDYYAHLIQQADVESAECIADAIYRGKKKT